MQLNLNDDEVSAILASLDYYLPQLREEIGKTENYDMRKELQAQEAALNSAITKLGGSVAGTDSPNVGAKNPPWGRG